MPCDDSLVACELLRGFAGLGDADDDIAGMERRADTLLRETLDRYERGAVDDATLTTFGLALEHFRDVARTARADAAARRE